MSIVRNKPFLAHSHISFKHFLIVGGLFALVSCGTHAQESNKSLADWRDGPNSSAIATAMDPIIHKEMEENYIPGMALVIVKDGETIYKKGYGVANIETGTQVDPEKTIFRIGSISKALTLLTLSKMVDTGKISKDDDVSQYFEGIKNPNGFDEAVTVKHLLTHTSGFDQIGLGRHVYNYEQSLDARKSQRPSLKDFLKDDNMRRITPVGSYYRYDTYGSTLAGAILEELTGLPYDQAMKQEMFDPLGMSRSSVEVDDIYISDLAKGHGYNDGTYEVMPYEVYNTTPASSIDATPADMGRLLEALTSDGSNNQGRFLSSQITTALRQSQWQPHPEFVGISHGLQESNYVGTMPDAYKVRTFGHGGDMLGISSLMVTIPSLNVGLFITANRNSEAGGARVNLWRLIMPAILKYFEIAKHAEGFPIPKKMQKANLDEYNGKYYFGVFCHSCSQEEYEQYAWRRPSRPIEITNEENLLILNEDKYIPRGEDIFVREDGYEKIFFGRDKNGTITFMVFSDGLTSFERIED